VVYSQKYQVGSPTHLLQKKSMKSFGLSNEVAHNKNEWRLRMKGATANWLTAIYLEIAIKTVSVCVLCLGECMSETSIPAASGFSLLCVWQSGRCQQYS